MQGKNTFLILLFDFSFYFLTFKLYNYFLFFCMFTQKKSSLWVKKIIVCWCWILLWWGIIYFLQTNPDLSASVLSLQEQKYFKESTWDVGYKKKVGELEVFLAPQLHGTSGLYFSFFHSPQLLTLDGSIHSPYHFDILSSDNTNLVVFVSWFQNGNVNEEILKVPFKWEMKDIVIESVSFSLEGESLSLGNLDESQIFA